MQSSTALHRVPRAPPHQPPDAGDRDRRTDSDNKLTTKPHWDSRSNVVLRINAEDNPTRSAFDPLDRSIKRERALATGAMLDDITQAQVPARPLPFQSDVERTTSNVEPLPGR